MRRQRVAVQRVAAQPSGSGGIWPAACVSSRLESFWTFLVLLTRGGGLVTPREVLALCREKDVKAVDLRFMDFPGLWQHFTIPVSKLDEDVFEDGLGFDGSSIRG
jgi:hypothetical protein